MKDCRSNLFWGGGQIKHSRCPLGMQMEILNKQLDV